jgi:hypothetical protein
MVSLTCAGAATLRIFAPRRTILTMTSPQAIPSSTAAPETQADPPMPGIALALAILGWPSFAFGLVLIAGGIHNDAVEPLRNGASLVIGALLLIAFAHAITLLDRIERHLRRANGDSRS